jgi:HSP20 family protein
MLTRYDPFREGLSLRRAMDQLFEQSFVNPRAIAALPSMAAPIDVRETNNGYEVDVSLPGVRPEDVELTVDQNTLTIRGRYSQQNDHGDQAQQGQQDGGQQAQQSQQDRGQQAQQSQRGRTRRHRQGHNWLSREIVYGEFERTVTFPRPIDPNNIQTKFENGILTITLPVTEASRPRRISLSGGQSQQKITSGSGQQNVTAGSGSASSSSQQQAGSASSSSQQQAGSGSASSSSKQ